MSTKIHRSYSGPWQIYGLKDPRDGLFRYIGCTTEIGLRLGIHLRQTNNPALANWFDSLGELDLTVLTLEVGSGISHLDRESCWIRKLKREGHPLLNVIYRGAKRPPQVIENVKKGLKNVKPSRSLTRAASIKDSWILRRVQGKDNRRSKGKFEEPENQRRFLELVKL